MALDIASVFAAESLVFLAANLIKRLGQVAYDVERVIDDKRLRGILLR